jgi:VanZ family protein
VTVTGGLVGTRASTYYRIDEDRLNVDDDVAEEVPGLTAPSSLVRRVSLWLPPIVYMAVIFHLSSESQPLPQLTEHVWDKLLHTIEYAGLGVLFFRALFGEGLRIRAATAATIVLVSSYGASDEWHQWFVPMRSSDVYDWLTDTLAGVIGAAVCVAFVMWRRRHDARR